LLKGNRDEPDYTIIDGQEVGALLHGAGNTGRYCTGDFGSIHAGANGREPAVVHDFTDHGSGEEA
jgi:hypothetical protein